MDAIKTFLDGKKTYLIGLVGLCVVGANLVGFLDAETANTLLGLLGFGGLISLRAGVSKAK